jgi:mono/diheme cytochrome c family protein
MIALAAAALVLALLPRASIGAEEEAHSGPEHGGIAVPVYQVRGPAPPGDRLAPGRDGHQLFRNRCGYCHLPGGMGANVLAVRMKARGEPLGKALLETRTDLEADYVKTVVRNGLVAMPRLTRVEVTDAELDAIAAYLAGPKPK